jgi:uncharacterized protein
MAVEPAAGKLTGLLDDFVGRVENVRQAVLLSRDGLTMGASRGLRRDDAEHLSALAAGVQSLARGVGRTFTAGEVRQVVIELEGALLFITAAGQGNCLAVLTSADADVGAVAYEMAIMVKCVGPQLAAAPRQPGSDPRDPNGLHDLAAG